MNDAWISQCGAYRYSLHRGWNTNALTQRAILWVMLNPSTADATINDRTISRCIEFSKTWGYDRLMVGNAYALRSTDPKGLWKVADPIGPNNADALHGMARQAEKIIVAWGVNCHPERAAIVTDLLKQYGDVWCMGVTKSGAPRHPLYLPGNMLPTRFESSQGEKS